MSRISIHIETIRARITGRKFRKRGFTLVEMILSMAISAMILLAVSTLVGPTTMLVAWAQNDAYGDQNAVTMIEYIRNELNTAYNIQVYLDPSTSTENIEIDQFTSREPPTYVWERSHYERRMLLLTNKRTTGMRNDFYRLYQRELDVSAANPIVAVSTVAGLGALNGKTLSECRVFNEPFYGEDKNFVPTVKVSDYETPANWLFLEFGVVQTDLNCLDKLGQNRAYTMSFLQYPWVEPTTLNQPAYPARLGGPPPADPTATKVTFHGGSPAAGSGSTAFEYTGEILIVYSVRTDFGW